MPGNFDPYAVAAAAQEEAERRRALAEELRLRAVRRPDRITFDDAGQMFVNAVPQRPLEKTYKPGLLGPQTLGALTDAYAKHATLRGVLQHPQESLEAWKSGGGMLFDALKESATLPERVATGEQPTQFADPRTGEVNFDPDFLRQTTDFGLNTMLGASVVPTKIATSGMREGGDVAGMFIGRRGVEAQPRPPRGQQLAQHADPQGWKNTIIGGVPEGVPEDVGLVRYGTNYITSPEGVTTRGGYFMGWPEPEWNISTDEWLAMPWEERAALESRQQATAYKPLSDQFEFYTKDWPKRPGGPTKKGWDENSLFSNAPDRKELLAALAARDWSDKPALYSALDRYVAGSPVETQRGIEWLNEMWPHKRVGLRDASNRQTGQFEYRPVNPQVAQHALTPDELSWREVPKFLTERADQQVSRQDLIDYLKSREFKLDEKVLGGKQARQQYGVRLIEYDERTGEYGHWEVFDRDTGRVAGRLSGHLDEPEALAEANSGMYRGTSNTRHGRWTTEGGENYQELLLKAPREPWEPKSRDTSKWTAKRNQGETDWSVRDENGDLVNSLRINARDEADAIRQALAHIERGDGTIGYGYGRESGFRHPHWQGEDNVLAHARSKEFGDDTLHVDEIQSDWHQQGRDRGYRPASPSVTAQRVKDQYKVWNQEFKRLKEKYPEAAGEEQERLFSADPGFAAADAELKRLQADDLAAQRGVPNAPLKDAWHRTVLKRMLVEAARRGKSRVTWTTDRTQAQRYGQLKRADAFDYNTQTHELRALSPTERQPILAETVKPEDLTRYMTPEEAKKLLEGHIRIQGEPHVHRITGSFDVGAGTFYDNTIVRDARRVGSLYDVEPRMGKLEPPLRYVVSQLPDGRWSVHGRGYEPGRDASPKFGSQEEARAWADAQEKAWNDKTPDVWEMDVHPDMAEGMALFANKANKLGLVVAVRDSETGRVIKGKPGQLHPDLIDENDPNFDIFTEGGFVTPDGQFLDRQQALRWVERNEADVAEVLRKKGVSSDARDGQMRDLEGIAYQGREDEFFANKGRGPGVISLADALAERNAVSKQKRFEELRARSEARDENGYPIESDLTDAEKAELEALFAEKSKRHEELAGKSDSGAELSAAELDEFDKLEQDLDDFGPQLDHIDRNELSTTVRGLTERAKYDEALKKQRDSFKIEKRGNGWWVVSDDLENGPFADQESAKINARAFFTDDPNFGVSPEDKSLIGGFAYNDAVERQRAAKLPVTRGKSEQELINMRDQVDADFEMGLLSDREYDTHLFAIESALRILERGK